MEGEGKENALTLVVGTHLKDGKPDHAWDGIVDANTTPDGNVGRLKVAHFCP